MEQPLHIFNPFAPIPFRMNGKTTLVYELFIHNKGEERYDLQQVDILNRTRSNKPIEVWEGEKVTENIRYLNNSYRPAEKNELLPENIGLVFFWLTFEPGQEIPTQLQHVLTLTNEKGKKRIDQVSFDVQSRVPLKIEAPIRGKSWVAAEAASNTTGHRRTPLFIDDAPYFAQRYAVDWLRFGPEGLLFKDNPEKNENWYSYGEEIRAVADGVVEEIQDGIIENIPLSEKMAVEINLQSAPGNYVMIDHGNDNYATYAHMLPGSLTIKAGDRVKSGQVIGKLGNSGNSTGPHLHFHIGHRRSPLGTHGVPYHINYFERTGNVGTSEHFEDMFEKGEPWQPKGVPEKRQDEYMCSNDVLNL